MCTKVGKEAVVDLSDDCVFVCVYFVVEYVDMCMCQIKLLNALIVWTHGM